ncbi:hypothetical protein H6790_01485 [Candidatus Nomurabacteria bacterium]|nr:hypothetical protein [Candidatus Nomurabacteria bacterium]
MKKNWSKIFIKTSSNNKNKEVFDPGKANTSSKSLTVDVNTEKRRKIEQGARDFADRFEDVMKELANG